MDMKQIIDPQFVAAVENMPPEAAVYACENPEQMRALTRSLDFPMGQHEGQFLWSRQSSLNAWKMCFDGTPGRDASPYASATRAKIFRGCRQPASSWAQPTCCAMSASSMRAPHDRQCPH